MRDSNTIISLINPTSFIIATRHSLAPLNQQKNQPRTMDGNKGKCRSEEEPEEPRSLQQPFKTTGLYINSKIVLNISARGGQGQFARLSRLMIDLVLSVSFYISLQLIFSDLICFLLPPLRDGYCCSRSSPALLFAQFACLVNNK